jgi:uncharacterized protein YlbG (UPF0298 family)
MRFVFLIVLGLCSINIFAQQQYIVFDSATTNNNVELDFKQITRTQANGYTIKIWFKNISQQTLYFYNQATAWNDVSDFGHYLRTPDSVKANHRNCIIVKMYLGQYKRRLNHYGNIVFRNRSDSIMATFNATLIANIMDSMMPLQSNHYILFDKNLDTANQILNIGTLVSKAQINGAHVVRFKNTSKYKMRLYTFKKWELFNDTILNTDTIKQNKYFSYRELFAYDTIAPNAYGWMHISVNTNNEVWNKYKLSKPTTIEYTLCDDGGAIETKTINVQLAATFAMPEFEATFIPSNLKIAQGEMTPNLKLITDNNPDVAYIKFENLTDKKFTIRLIPKMYKLNCFPFITTMLRALPGLRTEQQLVNAFDWYIRSDKPIVVEPFGYAAVGIFARKKTDLNTINWNKIEITIDGKKYNMEDFLKKYVVK